MEKNTILKISAIGLDKKGVNTLDFFLTSIVQIACVLVPEQDA
ncbi:MAG: hypothetical protein Q9N32_02545 [Gammaproteobacteria bacterium]|nr:hypothetical protein [Gammaproteobacteria bacterium]